MYLGLGMQLHRDGRQLVLDGAFYQRTIGWGPGRVRCLPGFGAADPRARRFLLFGGWLAERLAKRGIMDANQRVSVLGIARAHSVRGPFCTGAESVGGTGAATLNTCVIGIGTGPQNAAFQAIVPNGMRAKITASFLFMFTHRQRAGTRTW